ncbi:hypothetical protein G6F62_012057 [Rhizopus arrhizus]|nr:hypothetical protein G6F23_013552 [Rhizopus arrhizus]KAG1319010.1 hypothetical protein G6F62_012057 [Rhizopus arrhizus]KAG1320056.1 hypothetical protein G6F63_014444 [Rhizopus arrhizus]KAG1364678.1 hypothetical protein G6F61_013750 [Rhizopus arrhizus]
MSIQDDSAMVVDSVSGFVPSSVMTNKKEDNVAINLTQLRSEMDEQLKMFCHVRASGDDAAIDEALQGIDKTKRRIAAMLECQSFFKKLEMHQTSLEVAMRFLLGFPCLIGICLNSSWLPVSLDPFQMKKFLNLWSIS